MNRLRLLITGQVQGVGFRPCVYRIANDLGLTGWVQNNGDGVLIEIQGDSAHDFLHTLITNVPPLAHVESVKTIPRPLENEQSFQIIESKMGKVNTSIIPDASICAECLKELFDTKNRYYRYPFLNCTHCGPRLSITHRLPYDRASTSMHQFVFCEACKQEYLNPANRRYHAEPIACEQCGPVLTTTISNMVDSIKQGKIIALKGVGGYQLICDARNEAVIKKLRERKNRDAKPFAIMMANLQSVKTIAEVSLSAENYLISKERPIVLLPKKSNKLPDSIAPSLSHLGVMLPYTPLHYLIFNAFAGNPDGCDWLSDILQTTLIVTSANCGGEPLIKSDKNAVESLALIADEVISYNRDIVTRVDDSVIHMIDEAPVFIRRARGFVPRHIKLPYAIPNTLALGGYLKNTFCLTRGEDAYVSQHIGGLNNKATIDFFHETLTHFMTFLEIKPERTAHDLHPDCYTTRLANELGIPTVGVQHHHAHLASVMAEHQLVEPVLGLALDGFGLGPNGEAWGGELMLLHETQRNNTRWKDSGLKDAAYTHLGSLYPLPLLGGDQCAREPWRMAASILYLLGRVDEIPKRFKNQLNAEALSGILKNSPDLPKTSSCGRLFDAVSALLGLNFVSQYEGQAAMHLESHVTKPAVMQNGWRIMDTHLSLLPLLNELLDADPVTGANYFHGTLIAGLTEWVTMWAKKLNISTIVLGGGCFLNKVLSEGLIRSLLKQNIKALLPRQLPPNDGGIALGQAWIAGRKQICV